MPYLNTFDYVVIGVYASILLGLGIALSRKAGASLDDYFLGGRKLPWWALGISGMASFLDVAGTMLIVSFLFMLGPRGFYIEFRGGAVLVIAVILLWTAKWNRRSNCMTGAEWMAYRFGEGLGGQFARIVSAAFTIVGLIGGLAYMTKGIGLFLSTFLPYTPIQCAIGMVTIATLYTMMSGFYGVVYTDIVQSAIILIAVVTVSVLAINAIGSSDVDLDTFAREVTGSTGWTAAAPQATVDFPPGYTQYNGLMLFAFFYLFKNIVLGMGMGQDAKYYGARNERECGTQAFFLTWLMMFRWPMMMAFAVLGLFLVRDKLPDQAQVLAAANQIKAHLVSEQNLGGDEPMDITAIDKVSTIIHPGYWPQRLSGLADDPASDSELSSQLEDVLGTGWRGQLPSIIAAEARLRDALPPTEWEESIARIAKDQPAELSAQLEQRLGDDWPRKLKLIGYEGTVNPERILPAVMLFDIPVGLRGLLLVALLAASMSTFDTNVNMASAYFTRDLYQRYWRPTARNRELMLVTYAFIVFAVSAGLWMGYAATSINDIWQWLMMGLGAGILAPGMLKYYWWRFNAGGVVVGTLSGLVAAVIHRVFDAQINAALAPFLPDFLAGELSGFVLIALVGLAGSVIGTYVTAPPNDDVLWNFYRTTRPFGLWKPMKNRLEPAVRDIVSREHRNDIIALPFTLGWQITLFLLPMLAIVGNWSAFAWTAVLFLFCLGGMYLFWYRHLPAASAGVLDDPEKLLAAHNATDTKTHNQKRQSFGVTR